MTGDALGSEGHVSMRLGACGSVFLSKNVSDNLHHLTRGWSLQVSR